MRFKLPTLNKYYILPLDTSIKLRFKFPNTHWSNLNFYRVHSQRPSLVKTILDYQAYSNSIKNDGRFDYIDFDIPSGTRIKFIKMISNISFIHQYVTISILPSKNKDTDWKWPSLQFSLPINEFEQLELEDVT